MLSIWCSPNQATIVSHRSCCFRFSVSHLFTVGWSLEQLLQLSSEPATNTPSKTGSTKLTMAEIAKQMSEKPEPPSGKSFVSKPMKKGVPFCAPKPGVKIPEEVLTALKDRKHVMIVMRGLPGSGKSNLS